MSKSRILIQVDPDRQPSVFDSVVAVDSGVEQLFRHHSVELEDIQGMVHGAIFTRGPADLKSTAIFVGGNDVGKAEDILAKIKSTFFGPMRVSVMLDANGCNTTAAAAVLCAEKHLPLQGSTVAVLGGTGPVGQRIVRLTARKGARVFVGSRSLGRASAICEALKGDEPDWELTPFATQESNWVESVRHCETLFGAGAAGCELISAEELSVFSQAKVLIDLNAVPPAGIPGVDVMAAGAEINGAIVYGAIGVGGLKMKIHKAAIGKLFETNDQVLDAEEIYDVGEGLITS